MPIHIERHAVNQGLGATIRDGLRAASAMAGDRDIIVAMDADNTHPPGLIHDLARQIREGADVAIASRYRPGALCRGVSWPRRVLSRGAAVFFKLILPIRGVRDYTCGYRAYRAAALKEAFDAYGEAFIDQAGFQCMVDILLKLRRMNLIFRETPLVLRYDRKGGASKMNVAGTVLATLSLAVRRRLGR